VATPSFLQKHDFLLRRLHSLSGLVPIGVFLIAHLVTNSSLLWGKYGLRGAGEKYDFGKDGVSTLEGGIAYFQKEVSWINSQVPHLLLIEISLWAAIAFHSIFGIYIASTGKSNTARYGYGANWRYWLQRFSGYVGILFIFYHVATLRWGWTFLVPDGTKWSSDFAASSLAQALTGGSLGMDALVGGLYFLGVTLLVFHFANGLWTSAITWGLTISRQAQQRWALVCVGLGAGLMVMGWSALGAVLLIDPAKAEIVERQIMHSERSGSTLSSPAPLPSSTLQTDQASSAAGTATNTR
jgi:succinate dehydrogenase / fumarate reductase, cytochrome b subunit